MSHEFIGNNDKEVIPNLQNWSLIAKSSLVSYPGPPPFGRVSYLSA